MEVKFSYHTWRYNSN